MTTGRLHAYAPVLDTGPEMARLVAELNAEDFKSSHPVLQASYAHYAFVAVHPFADGNGRVARALTSAYLYRDPGVPFLVFADQKPAYLDALEAADAGQFVAFIGFVAARSIDAVELIRGEVNRITARLRRHRAISAFREALESPHGLSHLEIDAVASRLLDEVHTEFSRQIGDLQLPQSLSFGEALQGGAGVTAPAGYRQVHSSVRYVQVNAQSQPPARVGLARQFAAFVALPDSQGPQFLVSGSQVEPLSIDLGELHPVISGVAHMKIAAWVEIQLADQIEQLYIQVEAALRESGYR